MGLPARKPTATASGAGRARTAHLRLVPATHRPLRTAPAGSGAVRKSKPKAARGPAEAACKSAFQVMLVALVALTVLGLVRVTLSAKAAEASVDQLRLERSIKAESRVGDRLELDRSLLVTPSRIESIAAGLQMTKAPAVRYIPLPASNGVESTAATASPSTVSDSAAAPKRGRSMAAMLGAALEVTEKEARTLLVGDVGVAASR